jgi:hypothetical protein
MAKEFTKNLFIMLLAIMIGIIIITYFVADIINRSKIETLEEAIITVKGMSENFTSYFLKSSVVLDQAREDRAFGNYNFDLAFLWYQSALYEKNSSLMDLYKGRGIDNCTNALPNYYNSYLNFEEAKNFFNDTKIYSEEKHLSILDLYIILTESGSRLAMLRYNASIYLMYLTENLTFDAANNSVFYMENVTDLLGLFEITMQAYKEEQKKYDQVQEEIDEYEFFDEIR